MWEVLEKFVGAFLIDLVAPLDEALDESIVINAVYLTTWLQGGASAPLYVVRYTAFIPIDSSKASSQWGNQVNQKSTKK